MQKLEYLCQLFGLCYSEESTIGLLYDILCCITRTDSSFDIESVSEYMMSNQLDMLSMLLKENLDHIDVNLILRGDPRHVEMLVDILFESTHAVLASSQNASTRQNLSSRPGAGSIKYQDDTSLKLINDVHQLDNQRNFVQFNQSHVDRKLQHISYQSVNTKQILINKRSEDMQMVAKDLRRELDSCYELIDAYVASVQSSYAHKIQYDLEKILNCNLLDYKHLIKQQIANAQRKSSSQTQPRKKEEIKRQVLREALCSVRNPKLGEDIDEVELVESHTQYLRNQILYWRDLKLMMTEHLEQFKSDF
ncbi:hypothetical protein MP228_003583 [Amoeboaphelidium protococcarum]|nr:hypothetical protein MP228_003583 [Amoeboaphelidium protococcarum]